MSLAPLHMAGERIMLCPTGVALWPATRTLIAADLHLEKGSHFAARGRPLPPYDTRATLEHLARAFRRHEPQRVVFLGDSFHDPTGQSRLSGEDKALLLRLLGGREVVWVLGNHDPCAPLGLPGNACDELAAGPLRFRHIGGGALARHGEAEISGHFHPKAALTTRAGLFTRPCFVGDGRRLVMPALGAYTGGLDVRAPALRGLFPRGARVFLIGSERLFSAPLSACG
jgi:DNA ligase-associated metallophosphoesterase